MPALALGVIVIVAAGLRFARLGDVPGNPFYDAAVHTMSTSWHAFLFGGFDPSGGVSVDKPPVDLWLQVAAVKLLGFTPVALKLPQALAGSLSVVLLFDIVRRGFGIGAGLAAAAALAVLPVAVLTARSDTMDTAMSALLLLAAWLIVRAIERGRSAWLLAAGAAVGLAFNVKLFQALLPLPALALLWLLGSPLPPLRRAMTGLAAVAVAVVVGFAWIVPVALTPASQRPYPIGSTNGSIWNLVFVFNGADRLHGRPLSTPDTLPAGSRVSSAITQSQRKRARHLSTRSPALLFGPRFGRRIGSELFPALITLALATALALVAVIRRIRLRSRERLRVAIAAAFGAWTVTGVVVFGVMGSFHPRYFETISPAVAALVGAGLGVLVLRGGRAGRLSAAIVLAATAIYANSLGTGSRLEVAACALAACVLVALSIPAKPRRAALGVATALAVAALAVIPAAGSLDVVHTRAFDAERSGAMPPGWPPLINRYLRAHRAGTRYAFASVSPGKAAPLVAADPQPVLMLTSYRSRPLLSVAQLARRVRAGEVRFFLIGRRCTSALTSGTAACPATARWAIAHSRDVTRAVGIGHNGLIYEIETCSSVSRTAPAPGSGRGRSATRSARRRSARSASRPSRATCVPRRTA